MLFEGARAGSVEFIRRGRTHRVYADFEVIRSGGTFNSPRVLLCSGGNDPGELERHDTGVLHDLPLVVSANLDCPTLMIAEKASDLVAGRMPLAAEHLPYYRAGDRTHAVG